MNLGVNSTFVSIPNPTTAVQATCATAATLTAPQGFAPYIWNGPPGSGITNNTNTVIATSVAGNYTLNMNPLGACNAFNKVIALSFPPPVVLSASPATVCPGGTSNLSASGAASYTWDNGSNSSNTSVSPTATTIYSVTVQTGTCIGTKTLQVTVIPTPTLTVGNTDPFICGGGTSTLSANGANTYTWNPGGATGSSVVVTPGSTTIYTVTGSNGACVDTETTTVIVGSAVTPTLFNLTGTVCAGSPVQLVGAGYSTFTWIPTSPLVISPIPVLTPTATTQYTAIGGSGSCTNIAVITVTADTGPTITPVATPTIVCPGNSATLSATAIGAVGSLTWTPGSTVGSSVQVTPPTTSVYSVTGVNSNNCRHTSTITEVVAPLPAITILPATPTVCIGSAITLTASGGVSYTWTAGPNTATRSVAPLVNTTYTVTASNGTCSTSQTVAVTVVPLPAIVASASSPTVCQGNPVTLTGSGGTSYTWNPGNLSGSSIAVTPVSTSTYILSGSNGACTNTAAVVVTVNPRPTITASGLPTSVCPGSCAVISPSGAVTYTISSPSFTVCPLVSTTYSINGTNSFGCVSNTPATVLISVNPVPVINIAASSPSVCAGAGVSFTASGANTYTWSTGLVAAVLTTSPPTSSIYTVTGTNATGCVSQKTVAVTVVPNPVVTAAAAPGAVCAGSCATLTASNASTYTWTPGNLSGASIAVCPPATQIYTVTGNAAGCLGTTTVQLTVNTAPTLNVASSAASVCPGNSATLTTSGTATSFTWLPSNTSGASLVVSPVVATTYTVIGANAGGCTITRTISVGINPVPLVSAAASSPTVCIGNSVTLTGSGAVSYTWSTGAVAASVSVSPLVNTTYTVTGANATGCTAQATVAVTVIPKPMVLASATPSLVCPSATAILTASGAATYTWSTGSTGASTAVNPALTTVYTVLGTLNGCTSLPASVTVSVTPPPVLSAINPSPSPVCPGITSTLSTSGATSYTWQPGNLGGSSIVVNPPVTTTYTVYGANAAGCVTTRTAAVVVYPAPVVGITASQNTICSGGSAVLTATGASSYVWSPGGSAGTNLTVSPSVNTTYTVTGTSSVGCTAQATIAIGVVSTPTLIASASPTAVCAGQSATLTASGASSYLWNGTTPGSSLVVTPVSTTAYTVLGTNSSCTAQAVVNVVVNPVPVISITPASPTICTGQSATLSGSGASSYTWSTGSTLASIVVTPSVGTLYTLSGTSAVGCTGTKTVFVAVQPVPVVSISAVPASICAGQTTTLSASGANSYVWLPGGGGGASIAVSPPVSTTYSVIGTVGSCTAMATKVVTVNANPVVSASALPSSICPGATSTLSASGASTYSWAPVGAIGQTTAVQPLTTTSYTLFAATAAGCTGTTAVTVVVNPGVALGISPSATAVCAGQCALLTASGATGYTWMPGNATGATFNACPASATVYTVTGASAAGCIGTATATVGVNALPVILTGAIPSTICAGQSSTLDVISPLFGYTWTPGNSTSILTPVTPASTTVYTLTAFNGSCTATSTRTVFVNPLPVVTASASPASICAGGTVTLTAAGAATFAWAPILQTGATVTDNPAASTIYTVAGASALGCFNTATVGVTVNSLPSVSIAATSTAICSGTGATLTASGATNYSWSPTGQTVASIVVSPGSSTSYTVRGFNAAGCSGTAAVTISVTATPTLIASTLSPSVCLGNTTALTASGGTAYTWQPGGVSGSPAVVTPIGNSVYTVTSVNGSCTGSATVAVSTLSLPVLLASATPTGVCAGGTSTLSVTGASTYTWLPMLQAGSQVTVSPAASSVYSVNGAAANGCTATANVSVTLLPNPVVSIVASSPSICAGQSATLSAGGASTYTWLPGGSNSNSIVVTPGSTSNYTLTGSNGGCSASVSLAVTVNPLPVIAASASPATLCAGSTVSLSATGGVSYTWQPMASTGSSVTDQPVANAVYTVTGEDANGCGNTATVGVAVNPLPLVAAVVTPTGICEGATVSVSASGATTYTWLPGNQAASTITDTPPTSTTYSVIGTDGNGCSDTATAAVAVFTNPTVTALPVNGSVCIGSAITLTASGATSYTWLPSNNTGSVSTESPVSTTNYTVTGDNGGICFSSFTLDVVVNPLPANVVASASGTITCASPTINLTGGSSSPNVSYQWNGPQSFTSNAQNPASVNVWGTFTLSVMDTITGCIATTTVDVPTDNSIPLVTVNASGSITCGSPQVTLTAVHTTTNPGYAWTGPGAISGNSLTVSVATGGDYTVVVTDLTSNCTGSAVVSVGVHTNVATTATITAATCSAGVSLNDGAITVSGFGPADKFDLVAGATYTGSATYTSATLIPANGVITNNLANPTTTVAFTLKVFDSEGCEQVYPLILQPMDCSLRPLGLAKSVSTPTSNNDGSYNVNYKITVRNYDTLALSAIQVSDNLAGVFSSPASYTITGAPSLQNGTGLALNGGYDGSSQTALLANTSSLAPGASDTIMFSLRVATIGFFGPFMNSATGTAMASAGVAVADSSQSGVDPDPDHDGNPMNNNQGTPLSLPPDVFFGLTKVGAFQQQDDNSFDVTYTITVHNLGNDTLRDVVVKDSLLRTVPHPASYSIKAGPVTTGALQANAAFNGSTSIALLSAGSRMDPGTTSTISFTINVKADTVTILRNSAFGRANKSHDPNNPLYVSDTSGAGNDPDVNHNHIWNEPVDNVPTVLILPATAESSTLFIPQGFSPNGDGINDQFHIRGLPETGDNSLTIFNRWGNRVYYHANYNNTWDGYPNIAGTLGRDKLPQGTYYYILEMKGSGAKPVTGFIVLQY